MSEQDTATPETDAPEAEVEEQSAGAQEPQEGIASNLDEADKEIAWEPERARKKIAKLNNEIRAVKEKAKEADEKFATVAEKDSRIADLEKQALRYEVAFDLGLPKQIASRLQGNTREEMIADAQQLVDLIAPAKRPTQKPTETLRGGLEPEREPEETDTRKIAERMFRN